MRGFCHEHFLSYIRMREWRDIHDQLVEVLEEREDFKLTSIRDGLCSNPKSQVPNPKLQGPNAKSQIPDLKLRAQNSKLKAPNLRPRTLNPEPRTLNPELAFGTPAYRAIHRSIFSGLLGSIAVFDEQSGLYKATHERKVTLFPGSGLYVKSQAKGKPSSTKASASAETTADRRADGSEDGGLRERRAARWIMAAEIVETTRVYARTVARLDPAWALDLGAHLLKVSHTEPFWNAEAGRVLVKRRARLYGLELESRAVGYGKVDPVHATELFIREGLVNDTITWPFDFLAHNRRVRDKVEIVLTRTRSSGYLNLDEAIYRFYAARLLPAEDGEGPPCRGGDGAPGGMPVEALAKSGRALPREEVARPSASARVVTDEAVAPYLGVSSVPELVDLVRGRRMTDPKFLCFEAGDLRGAEEAAHDAAAFPDALPIENRVLPLDYAYRPGQDEDGVTIKVSVRDAGALTSAALDWAVPGHLHEKVLHLLKTLPIGQRRLLIPLAETARTATCAVAQRARLRGHQDSLAATLAGYLREAHQLAVDLNLWADKPLPDYLRVRVQVVDERGQPLVASRDLDELHRLVKQQQRQLSAEVAREDPVAWRRARERWEKDGQTAWTFGAIPERVHVCDQAGVPVYAYPALAPVETGVALRLFKAPEEAREALGRGLFQLFELQLRYELAWLQRDLRSLRTLGVLAAAWIPVEALQEQAYATLRRWACMRAVEPLTEAAFAREVERARTDLRGVVPRLVDLLREILALRQELLMHPRAYPDMAGDLVALLPADFVAATPFLQLAHLPRYLKAMRLRADRWKENPGRDADRAKRLAPYVKALATLRTGSGGSDAEQAHLPIVAGASGMGDLPAVASGEGRVLPMEARCFGHRETWTPPTIGRCAHAEQRFRWLVEEFRVSLFAQELGTAEPVSPVKLDRELNALRHPASAGGSRAGDAAKAADRLPPPAAVPAPAKGPLKSLGALDRLFPKA
jgi:ATP-dependent helicase HrpA